MLASLVWQMGVTFCLRYYGLFHTAGKSARVNTEQRPLFPSAHPSGESLFPSAHTQAGVVEEAPEFESQPCLWPGS
jgi:hypothetical protein